MIGPWKSLFTNTAFTGAATKTSGGLFVRNAELVQVQFYSDGNTSTNLSAVSVLYDENMDGSGVTTFRGDAGTQASAPVLLTDLPASAKVDMTDVVAKALGTTPKVGTIAFVHSLSGLYLSGETPLQRLYLKVTSSGTLNLWARARAVSSRQTGHAFDFPVNGSVV